jgi:hypothetical protein
MGDDDAVSLFRYHQMGKYGIDQGQYLDSDNEYAPHNSSFSDKRGHARDSRESISSIIQDGSDHRSSGYRPNESNCYDEDTSEVLYTWQSPLDHSPDHLHNPPGIPPSPSSFIKTEENETAEPPEDDPYQDQSWSARYDTRFVSPLNASCDYFLETSADLTKQSDDTYTFPNPYDSNDRLVDSGFGGECLRDIEDIDFEFVYALHTFVATVEGQANATKGDTMVLLDDSNSYWWLVRVVKDSSIGENCSLRGSCGIPLTRSRLLACRTHRNPHGAPRPSQQAQKYRRKHSETRCQQIARLTINFSFRRRC